MKIDEFLEATRIAVGAKSASWREHGPCGFPPNIECSWSWGDRGVSFLFSDEILSFPPDIVWMIAKVRDLSDRRIGG